MIVNVQGDEPMLDPAAIDAAAGALLDDPKLAMATLSVPLARSRRCSPRRSSRWSSTPRRRAVLLAQPHPPVRLGASADLRAAAEAAIARGPRAPARRVSTPTGATRCGASPLPRAPLERAEGLEQLRALHHGMRIRVVPIDGERARGVDTPEDLERVRALLAPEKGGSLTKYIFVTGGVVSSLGKGLASASIGASSRATASRSR